MRYDGNYTVVPVADYGGNGTIQVWVQEVIVILVVVVVVVEMFWFESNPLIEDLTCENVTLQTFLVPTPTMVRKQPLRANPFQPNSHESPPK